MEYRRRFFPLWEKQRLTILLLERRIPMDKKQSVQEITVREAARSLGVSTKTIQRYFTKGLLTKMKHGARTYVLVSEINAVHASRLKGANPGKLRISPHHRSEPFKDTIAIDRKQYENLLIELGELRKEREIHFTLASSIRELQEKTSSIEDRIESYHRRLEATESGYSDMSRRIAEALKSPSGREEESGSSKLPKPWWQK